MAGNPSFDGLIAFTSERQMLRDWAMIWPNEWPLLQMIRAKKVNFNTAEEDPQGNSILFPINYLAPTTSARRGNDANAYTPITPNATRGFTQAQYFYARWENAIYLTPTEKTQIAKSAGGTTRMPILPGKVDQLMADFKDVVTTDILGTQNGEAASGAGTITGEQYFLSTSNSPGGISQTTYPKWAATVRTGAGDFYEGLIDREISRIGDLGRGDADFIQLSYTDTNDVYTKLYGLMAPSQIVTKTGGELDYGFKTFKYRDLDCFRDGKLGGQLAGSMVIGRSGAIHVSQKTETPVMTARDGTIRLPGTGSDEYFYEWWLTWGFNDCAALTLVKDIR